MNLQQLTEAREKVLRGLESKLTVYTCGDGWLPVHAQAVTALCSMYDVFSREIDRLLCDSMLEQEHRFAMGQAAGTPLPMQEGTSKVAATTTTSESIIQRVVKAAAEAERKEKGGGA